MSLSPIYDEVKPLPIPVDYHELEPGSLFYPVMAAADDVYVWKKLDGREYIVWSRKYPTGLVQSDGMIRAFGPCIPVTEHWHRAVYLYFFDFLTHQCNHDMTGVDPSEYAKLCIPVLVNRVLAWYRRHTNMRWEAHKWKRGMYIGETLGDNPMEDTPWLIWEEDLIARAIRSGCPDVQGLPAEIWEMMSPARLVG